MSTLFNTNSRLHDADKWWFFEKKRVVFQFCFFIIVKKPHKKIDGQFQETIPTDMHTMNNLQHWTVLQEFLVVFKKILRNWKKTETFAIQVRSRDNVLRIGEEKVPGSEIKPNIVQAWTHLANIWRRRQPF